MISQVKPTYTSVNAANVQSVVFCTFKYNSYYLLLCGPDGTVTGWRDLKAAEKSWKRNYTRLARHRSVAELQQHFNFFKPMLHVVTNVMDFELTVCPEPRETVDCEYIVGNCLGITCNIQACEQLRKTGTPININFSVVERIARSGRT
jgi:hypothetical protein